MSNKKDSELHFWKREKPYFLSLLAEDPIPLKKLYLAIAEENNDKFLKDKNVGDFGCGPICSLKWANSAKLRIGIDVLVLEYSKIYREQFKNDGMIYVACTEDYIPIPSNFFDVMFNVNAMDHVQDFKRSCDEILRLIRAGGTLIASFNLNEPPSRCEPQTLTEKILQENLLNYFHVVSYRVARKTSGNNRYKNFFNDKLGMDPNERGVLWFRGEKK